MTGTKEDSEFCFPETLNVPHLKAKRNIEGQGGTKLNVFREASH